MRRLLAAFAIVGMWAQPAGAATVTHRAVFYGDSLMWEAGPQIAAKFAPNTHWAVVVKGRATTAPCDWLPGEAADLANYRPTVVVVETVGNSHTACMDDPATGQPWPYGSDGYLARYQADLGAFVATAEAAGATVVFAKPPPLGIWWWDVAASEVSAIGVALPGVHVAVGPRNSVAKNGLFTWTKPCLLSETAAVGCVSGRIVVRAPDGIHFCPSGVNLAGCPEYSSGAYRFGNALAAAAVSPPR